MPFNREYQVFVKPVGARCNLECSYCYYVDRDRHDPVTGAEIMPDDLLEELIRQYLEAAEGSEVFFTWHGGEPTLAGIDFYRKAVALQKKYAKKGITVTNGIQTNGILIDEAWCEFLKKESFEVGISLDGPYRLHDYFRVARTRKPTHSRAIRGYRLLKEQGIDPEILCVVNALNVEYPLEVYYYFREIGARNLAFFPLVERKPVPLGPVTYQSVPARDYGRFLCAVFDEWIEKDVGTISIEIFEEVARAISGREHAQCIFKTVCGNVPAVERNGEVFSCDFYADREHRIGNIRETRLARLLDHPSQKAFGKDKEVSLPQQCRSCEVLVMCNGGCPKNRFLAAADGEPGLNYLCEGYMKFFTHSRAIMDAVNPIPLPV